MSLDEFKAWLKFADTTRPIAKQLREGDTPGQGVDLPSEIKRLSDAIQTDEEGRPALIKELGEVCEGVSS